MAFYLKGKTPLNANDLSLKEATERNGDLTPIDKAIPGVVPCYGCLELFVSTGGNALQHC